MSQSIAEPERAACNILYVVPEKHPFFRADLTELFSNGVVKSGCNITWVLQSENTLESIQIENQLNERFVIHPASAKGLRRAIQSQCVVFNIAKELRKNKYDFIQVRDKHLGALIALVVAKFNAIPFIYWMSFPYAEGYLMRAKEFTHMSFLKRSVLYVRGILSRFMRNKILLRYADFVFVQSDKMKQDMEKVGVDSEKMMAIPMGVAFDKLQQVNSVKVDSTEFKGKKVVAYLGTLARIRQPEFMLRVIASVREKFNDAVLLFIGDAADSDMTFLRDQVNQMGLQNDVIFTGFVPMEKAWAYVQCADVCLSPFRPSPILDSTTPTKLIEYLALGKAVVVNTHPDQSKVIDESGGGIAVDYDADAFSSAVCQLLDNPEMSEDMGKKGKQYVQLHRSYDALASMLGEKYQELQQDFTKR